MERTQEVESTLIIRQHYEAFDSFTEDFCDVGDEPEYPVSLNSIELI